MIGKKEHFLQNPEDKSIHLAIQHPVYSDHYITNCGMVVTTSATRHETNLTEFVILEASNATCEDCKNS